MPGDMTMIDLYLGLISSKKSRDIAMIKLSRKQSDTKWPRVQIQKWQSLKHSYKKEKRDMTECTGNHSIAKQQMDMEIIKSSWK